MSFLNSLFVVFCFKVSLVEKQTRKTKELPNPHVPNTRVQGEPLHLSPLALDRNDMQSHSSFAFFSATLTLRATATSRRNLSRFDFARAPHSTLSSPCFLSPSRHSSRFDSHSNGRALPSSSRRHARTRARIVLQPQPRLSLSSLSALLLDRARSYPCRRSTRGTRAPLPFDLICYGVFASPRDKSKKIDCISMVWCLFSRFPCARKTNGTRFVLLCVCVFLFPFLASIFSGNLEQTQGYLATRQGTLRRIFCHGPGVCWFLRVCLCVCVLGLWSEGKTRALGVPCGVARYSWVERRCCL